MLHAASASHRTENSDHEFATELPAAASLVIQLDGSTNASPQTSSRGDSRR